MEQAVQRCVVELAGDRDLVDLLEGAQPAGKFVAKNLAVGNGGRGVAEGFENAVGVLHVDAGLVGGKIQFPYVFHVRGLTKLAHRLARQLVGGHGPQAAGAEAVDVQRRNAGALAEVLQPEALVEAELQQAQLAGALQHDVALGGGAQLGFVEGRLFDGQQFVKRRADHLEVFRFGHLVGDLHDLVDDVGHVGNR